METKSSDPPQLVLTGPTCSGKGRVAREIASRIDAELVSVDSMKVYRELDVVTAKPSAEIRARQRHHLIDVVGPDRDFTVAEFVTACRAVLADCARRGRAAILVGGTPLYVKALLEGLVEGPAADWELRERLQAEARERGLDVLWERLREVDPAAAARVCPEDERRIVRFLEYHALTGRPISASWSWSPVAQADGFRLFGLEWERAELYARTDRRVLRMVEEGLFDEAARLAAREPAIGRTARQCIGLKEVYAGRAAGQSDDEIIDSIQRNTRHLAKRQLTWFRKMPIEWIAVEEGARPEPVAEEILRRWRASRSGSDG